MNLKEHENNQFTKEQDKIEKYLLRIIQRYFDIENNYTKETIENMIIESLTRFKRDLIREKGFLFALNRKTGHITLTIQDFEGEYAFDKNTAFNKNFGVDSDTICQGNDSRLINAREALAHTHIIADMKSLENKLNGIKVPEGLHLHSNKNILDILTYTGSRVQIDLILLEYLENAINEYYKNLEYYQRELKSTKNKNIEDITFEFNKISQVLQNAKDILDGTSGWLQSAYDYTNQQVAVLKTKTTIDLIKYLPKEQAQSLKELYSKIFFTVIDGEILLDNGPITCISNNIDETNINEQRTVYHQFTNYVLDEIQNIRVKLYFRYESNGNTINTQLPFVFKTDDGRHIYVYGEYTDSGQITVKSNCVIIIPATVTSDNFYDDQTVIICNDSSIDMFYFTTIKLKNMDCTICKIDSSEKDLFVNGLLTTGKEYLIDGERSFIDNQYYDSNGNVMTYFNWTDNNPDMSEPTINIVTSNGKWKSVSCANEYGYVAEYKVKRLSDYFNNPRIYYQVLGNKEVL